jgi:uncharacterized iron-regulated protein
MVDGMIFHVALDFGGGSRKNYGMRSRTFILATAFLVFACFTRVCVGSDILRVRDGAVISFDRMIQEISNADIVFVGEVHGELAHHDLELGIISSFHEADRPLSVGLEMFRSDSQKDLNSWVSGSLSLEQFLPSYYDNWRVPWPSYRAIFLYAREHRIPLVGLNIPEDIVKAVAQGGFVSLNAEKKQKLPPGISCNIDPTYMEFIRKAYAGHPQQDSRRFLNFCEAQMVWDKSMAWKLIEYRKMNPGKTTIVLSGVGHAWKRGIPEQVARQSSFTYKVVLPEIPGQIERDSVSLHDADYVMLQ